MGGVVYRILLEAGESFLALFGGSIKRHLKRQFAQEKNVRYILSHMHDELKFGFKYYLAWCRGCTVRLSKKALYLI